MAYSKNKFWWLLASLILVIHTAARKTEINEEAQQREHDRVKSLPGQPLDVNFQHYAGYVDIDPNKAMFYWFFESQQNDNSPVVLWLNFGPGCSSIAFGAAQELGPFLVESNDTQLTFNKFSWNKVANMLFLEAPVGVGFSYTNNSEDMHKLGDGVTAADSHAFLRNWFRRFPNFRTRDFYLAGESYAGHFAPQLAELIYETNKKIGNALINNPTDTRGLVEYAWSHAIISDRLYKSINKECVFTHHNQTVECRAHFTAFLRVYADINMLSIYSPVCLNVARTSPKHIVAPLLNQHELPHRLPSGYDPCTATYVAKYFNREDVQRSLHANVTKLSYPYTPCSFLEWWNDSPDTVLPIIRKLLNAGLCIWIYSGDNDGRVPVTSTRYSINEIRLKVKEEWRAWFHKDQVAGWVETYESGLTFATVRGADHQVPILRPDESLSLFTHFLSAETLPSSRFQF